MSSSTGWYDNYQYHDIFIAWYDIVATTNYRLYHICLNKAEDLQDESEVVGFQEDSSTEGGLVNKSNTKLHATMKILWLSAWW